jgi:predicted Zn-dependent protease
LLAKALLPLILLFILAACGGSAKPKAAATAQLRGPGLRFSAPSGWTIRRTATSVSAVKGEARVSVTLFRLLKPYAPALFGRAAKELDGVAAKLAAQEGSTVEERETTTVDGRKIRAYRFASDTVQTRIGFVLVGRREYQLLCEGPAGTPDPDGACALLFSSFRVV